MKHLYFLSRTKTNLIFESKMKSESSIEIQKSTPSISEFTTMIRSYQGAQGKNLNRGLLQWNNEQENVVFHYMLLGEEAVVWHQKVRINKSQKIIMIPNKEAPVSYVFSYFFKANSPIKVSEEYLFEHKSLIFCNDQGSYQFVMPKGYEGHLLQIIISERFLRNYVDKKSLQHPYVNKIIEQLQQEQLIIPFVTPAVHAELSKIAEHLSLDGTTTSNKLQLLQLIANFTDLFFHEYLQNQSKKKNIQVRAVFRTEIKKFFSARLDKPFCGIDLLSDYFGVSPSTLKRLFTKHFNQTALAYFKTLRMNHAQQLLQSGKHSVSDVGLKLGFSTTSNFIRAYKEVLGITPGDEFQNKRRYISS